VECNRSHVRTIASLFLFFFFLECNRSESVDSSGSTESSVSERMNESFLGRPGMDLVAWDGIYGNVSMGKSRLDGYLP